MKLCIVLVALVGAVAAQKGTCDESQAAEAKKSINTCIAEKAKEMEKRREEKKAEKEAKKAEMNKCFTDNGCESPAALKEQLKTCRDTAIKEGFADNLLGCIKGKGVEVPDDIVKKLFKRGKGKGRGKGDKKDKKDKGQNKSVDRKEAKLDLLLKKLCVNGKADGAKNCVKLVRQVRKEARKAKKEERKGDKDEKKGKGLMKCFKDVSKPCQRSIQEDLCPCADPLKKEGVFQGVRKSIQDCKAKTLGEVIQPSANDDDNDDDDDDDNDDDDDDMTGDEASEKEKKIRKLVKLVCGNRGKGN